MTDEIFQPEMLQPEQVRHVAGWTTPFFHAATGTVYLSLTSLISMPTGQKALITVANLAIPLGVADELGQVLAGIRGLIQTATETKGSA